MNFDEAFKRVCRIRSRFQGASKTAFSSKKELRRLDAEALTIILKHACAPPEIEYIEPPPNNGYHEMGR